MIFADRVGENTEEGLPVTTLSSLQQSPAAPSPAPAAPVRVHLLHLRDLGACRTHRRPASCVWLCHRRRHLEVSTPPPADLPQLPVRALRGGRLHRAFRVLPDAARRKIRKWQLQNGFRNYVQRRAWRILPPYFAALLVSMLLIVVTASLTRVGGGTGEDLPWWTTSGLLTHLLLLHNLSPRWAGQINEAMWSVATEWQIYSSSHCSCSRSGGAGGCSP